MKIWVLAFQVQIILKEGHQFTTEKVSAFNQVVPDCGKLATIMSVACALKFC